MTRISVRWILDFSSVSYDFLNECHTFICTLMINTRDFEETGVLVNYDTPDFIRN
jgi:hypothetical protein